MCDKPEVIHPKTYQKYLQLYSNDDTKDVTFTFPNWTTKIRAHKLILATVSPVFKETLSGKEWASGYTVLSHTPLTFQKLIDVVYMQKITVSNLEEAVELYKAAKVYEIDDLKDLVTNYMLENTSYHNCFYVLEKAIQYELTEVAEKCRALLCVDEVKFTALFSLNHAINENIFIEFLEINQSPDSVLYQVLEFFVRSGKLNSYKKALGKIRFLTMAISEIILVSLLTETEKLAVIANIEANKTGVEPCMRMPEHLSSNAEMRQEKPGPSSKYKDFWTLMLFSSKMKHVPDLLKRICVLEVYSEKQMEQLIETFEKKLNGTNDEEIEKQVITYLRLTNNELTRVREILCEE